MYSAAFPKKTHNNQYGGYLLAIASISLLLFAVTSGTFAVPFTSNEHISHTSNELSAAGSGGLAAGHGVNVTTSRVGGAVFDAAEAAKEAGNTDTAQADFSGIGGAKSGSQEPDPAWQEPDAEDGSDGDGAGEGGMPPSGVYMVEAEPDTPYIFSARGVSSDLNGTYEPLVTAMEVDGNGRKIVEHNLSFSGCYDGATKEITFTTRPNVSEFYVSMNTWECNGTFQAKDVVLEVYEAPLPGISDLAHTAGRTWINWTWVNPADVRFAYVTVHLNGTYMGVTPDSFYNVTWLDSGDCCEIGVRTVDVDGNVSATEVNQTGETAAEGDDELTVRASDGLEFSLAESGAVSGVSIDGSEIPMLSVPGGFSFRDVSSTTPDILLEGAVEKNYDGSITQYVTSSDIAFRFDYIPRDRYIEVHGDVQDLRGVDRAIQVQYALPVDATGWQWGDYIRESREIGSGVRYENVYRIGEVRTQNTYPFTFVGEDAQGLSLAVPMDVPRIYRIGYDTGAGGYSIEYDFGLANCTDKIGAGHANFTFIMYKVDEPEWGFRAVAKKYYELYPEFFVKRTENEGLIAKWDFAVSKVPDIADFGVAYEDGYAYSGFGRMTESGYGIDTLVYSEPWGWWKDLGAGCTEPTYDEKLAIIQDDYLNGSDNTTWKGMANDSYVAEVIMNCMPYNKTGHWTFENDYLWKGGAQESLNYPTNPDPDLPSPNRFELTYLQFEHSNKSGIGCYDWRFGNNYYPRDILNNWTHADTEHHSGNYSASITIDGSPRIEDALYAMEYIPASPSTQYSFSAWGKVQDVFGTSPPSIKIDEFDVNKIYLGAATYISYGYGSTGWVQKSEEFTTGSNTAFMRPALYNGISNGSFYVDDIELYKDGDYDNLIVNPGFESVYNFSDYPCGGLRIDSTTTDFTWALFENYRRSHWKYTNYPLVFSYDTKEPVLLGALSQYEFLENIHLKMIEEDNVVAGNVFTTAYSFYPHLLDVLGSERWNLMFDDELGYRYRTMCYQKSIANMLVWNYQCPGDITHSEVEVYINDQMFYGMFPSMDWYNEDGDSFWKDSEIYERDRDLFVKYIPIIKNISAAGWEPIQYAACNNPNIKFERYGSIDEGLYYTVGSIGSEVRSGVLTIDLSKLGFDGTQVEIRELVTDRAYMQDAQDGKLYLSIVSLNPHDTQVYRLVS